jgi:hypothetical protein
MYACENPSPPHKILFKLFIFSSLKFFTKHSLKSLAKKVIYTDHKKCKGPFVNDKKRVEERKREKL